MKVLDTLEESKVIQSYEDLSDGDNVLKFKVKVNKDFDFKNALKILKLEKPITENYTTIDENNKIKVFNDCSERINSFIKVKLQYTQKRKDYLIRELQELISVLNSKVIFISKVVSKKLKVSNVPKSEIVLNLEKIKDIVKVQDSYDYLLKMPIYTLTLEKIQELNTLLSEKTNELKTLESKSPQQIWLEELNEIQRII